jgi:hypothetical protein
LASGNDDSARDSNRARRVNRVGCHGGSTAATIAATFGDGIPP